MLMYAHKGYVRIHKHTMKGIFNCVLMYAHKADASALQLSDGALNPF